MRVMIVLIVLSLILFAGCVSPEEKYQRMSYAAPDPDMVIYVENGTRYTVSEGSIYSLWRTLTRGYGGKKSEKIYAEGLIEKTLEFPSFIFYKNSSLTAVLLLKDDKKEYYIREGPMWIKYNTEFELISFKKNSLRIMNLTVRDIEGNVHGPEESYPGF